MKDLRERCERFLEMIDKNNLNDVEELEAFAREIRAEALEESAALLEGDARFVTKPHFGSYFQDARYECAGAIRKLKADALMAAEDEK